MANFWASLWLEWSFSRRGGFDLDCCWIFELIFDLISLYLAMSSAIFFAVFSLFLISYSNSPIWSFSEVNLDSTFCFSSGFWVNSTSCSVWLKVSLSRIIRSLADATSLSMLSNWAIFWFRISEMPVASSLSDSIFLSIECNPDDDLCSSDLTSWSCFSVFFLRLVASCFFFLRVRIKFSSDANDWVKAKESVKWCI